MRLVDNDDFHAVLINAFREEQKLCHLGLLPLFVSMYPYAVEMLKGIKGLRRSFRRGFYDLQEQLF
jgi:hypothetical protein